MGARQTAYVTLFLLFTTACSRVDNSAHVEAIQKTLGRTPDWVERSAHGKRLWVIERSFYESRGYMPAWIDGDRSTPHVEDLIQQFRNSELHGLDSAAYPIDEFERIRHASQTMMGTRFDAAHVPELDTKLTYGYLRYAADLVGWTSTPSALSRSWLAQPKTEDLVARLVRAIESNRVRDSLEQLAPTHPQYKGLQAALARERQQLTGQADRIRMNLERWRWAPNDLGDSYVLINVPTYTLQVMEGEKPVLAMRVIVGKPDTPTPLFSDEMTYIVFSPYWNIPENILRAETLPRAAKDPDFLNRNNIEVVGTSGPVDPWSIDWSDESTTSSLRLRQRPGPDNALGLVKFIFPNHFSVYLHDTPTEKLFVRNARTFSHGCIRIENPVGLAQYVLRDQPQWSAPRIAAAMHARREQHVRLKHPLPVHIGYWTAWVEPDSSVTFTDDPYRLDEAHARIMERRHPLP
ncbi:MAG TPA: L,D-transpeptidase family protein [Vicinamibacterales bacterium]